MHNRAMLALVLVPPFHLARALATTCARHQAVRAQSSSLATGPIRGLQRVSSLPSVLTLAEQIDQWFKHLASWEATLEEMAAASTDQNFTEELGAIEQCKL